MAWLLFLPSVLFLWVTFNGLFMVPSEHPGLYDPSLIVMACVAAFVALLFSFASGRLLVRRASDQRATYRAIFLAPPMVFCVVILLIYLAFLVL